MIKHLIQEATNSIAPFCSYNAQGAKVSAVSIFVDSADCQLITSATLAGNIGGDDAVNIVNVNTPNVCREIG
jgi:hypothetical protein